MALLEDDELLGERRVRYAHGLAGALLGEIDALLVEAGRPLDRVEAIALSVGPGSFTGLRIGLATALGLCFGTERGIVPVPTLAALASQAGAADPAVPMLDARKGEIYTGLYGADGEPLEEDRVVSPAAWLERLKELPAPRLLGPGARLYRNEIESRLGAGVLLDAERGQLRARSVARLGRRRLLGQGSTPPAQVELRYLRASQAEQRRSA